MILAPSIERRLLTGWLAALLLWAPLPFGSVTPWALSIVRLAALAAALLVVWREPLWESWPSVRVPVLALVALAALGLLQAAPWPSGLASRLSPGHAQLAASLPREGLPGVEVATRLTLAPAATLSTALSFLALAALMAAAAAAGRSARSRVWLLGAFVASLLFQLLYGLRGWLAGSYAIWGREVGGQAGRLRGTFVVADHAALFFEMGMVVCFAWGCWALRRAGAGERLERRLLLALPPLALWAGAFGGVLLTGSRAGLLAAVVGATAQALLLVWRSRRRWLVPVAVLPALAAVGLGLLTAGERGFGRLAATSAHEVLAGPRARVWGLALEIWRRFPGTGSGLGTWDDAMPLVQPADLVGVRFSRAHNDYLELLATAGLAGALLMALAIASLLRRLLRVERHGRSGAERAAALAALGALAAAGVHELFDFGLSIPANAVACVVLVAAAAAAPMERRPQEAATPLEVAAVDPARARGRGRGERSTGRDAA